MCQFLESLCGAQPCLALQLPLSSPAETLLWGPFLGLGLVLLEEPPDSPQSL